MIELPDVETLARIQFEAEVERDGPSLITWDTMTESVKAHRMRWAAKVRDALSPPKRDPRPHSRACGIDAHDHGPLCARDCPTC